MVEFLKKWSQWQSWIFLGLCILMIAGMFWSRALLSIGVIAFFLIALHPEKLKENFGLWKKDRFAIVCFLFFLLYFISGLWSVDKSAFWRSVTNKLPFAVLPFAFLSFSLYKIELRKALTIGLLILQLAVIAYSLNQLRIHFDAYLAGYQFSHTIPTTKYDDHIRFSLSLVLSLVVIFYYLFEKLEHKIHLVFKIFLYACGVVFIIYLHILAAKTGLLCLYLAVLFYVFMKLWKRNKILSMVSVILVLAIPVIAYFSIPTFKMKIDYVVYEISRSKSNEKLDYNLSSQGRIISYKVATTVLNDNLILGTGIGDLRDEMDINYQKMYPEVPPENRLVPHNQFLFTALTLGLLLSPILIFLLIFGFKRVASPYRLYAQTTALVFFISFVVEAMLEVQFGIFLYLFFTLFWKSNKLVRSEVDAL